MKICAIICEFNPFHNGHKYFLERAAELSHCDALLCIMSGDFTQRGEMCVLDKYARARHAVLGGADCVIELPTPFAVAPAEIFANGAVKVLSQIPEIKSIAFGCEDGSESDFFSAASILAEENETFKNILAGKLGGGESYIRSYSIAFERCGGDPKFLSKPNNILGVEYTKAILKRKADINIIPIKRVGSGFGDEKLGDGLSSAFAIRKNLSSPAIKRNVPDFVYSDLHDVTEAQRRFECAMRYKLFETDAAKLRGVWGCGEGLENRLKPLAHLPFERLVGEATSRRYSSSRIRRILCANLLGLYSEDCLKFMDAYLPVKVLAIRKNMADTLLPYLSTKPNYDDFYAQKCEILNENAQKIWKHLNGLPDKRDYMITA